MRPKSRKPSETGSTSRRHPFYGSRKMCAWLRRRGRVVNRKRVRRLMRRMGLESVAPKPDTSRPALQHKVYPYLLRNLEISRPDQVWCTDITYIRLAKGFVYLTAVMDWHSRYVLSWEIVGDDGRGVLRQCPGKRLARPWPPGDLQHRSSWRKLHGGAQGGRCADQHGWQGSGAG